MKRVLALILAAALLALPACGAKKPEPTPPPEIRPPFLQREAFREDELRWIQLSEDLCTAGVTVPEELTDQDKLAFFRYIISTGLYEDRLADWQTAEGYQIPLADVEEVIFAHLDTDAFDPAGAFASPTQWQWYDAESQVYHITTVGGYGGARAMGVQEYTREGDEVHVILGLYEMNGFYSDPPNYIQQSRWETRFLLTGEGTREFQALKSEEMEEIQGYYTVYQTAQ